MDSTHVFDVNLVYEPEADRVESSEGSIFAYIGSGSGTVSGPKVEGELRWSLFEEQNELACRVLRTGMIETRDGAAIEMEELGYFGRENERTSLWHFAGGVRFKTEDDRYRWLMKHPAMLEGQMDLSTGKGRLTVSAINGVDHHAR